MTQQVSKTRAVFSFSSVQKVHKLLKVFHFRILLFLEVTNDEQ